jgi:hypothetical protein
MTILLVEDDEVIAEFVVPHERPDEMTAPRSALPRQTWRPSSALPILIAVPSQPKRSAMIFP